MSEQPRYPFTAIVGQERMRLALQLHAVDPCLGGVLVRGQKGTAKSTAVRALAALLPLTAAVAGCPYGCDPADPGHACDDCAAAIATGEPVATTNRPTPIVELPIGATEDRLIGSLDLEHALQSGGRRFEPGLLAAANRGILYVDEVNLLGDHLVDVILDAAAMGRNYVEREGISFSHPASFMLVGTMNPEEGDLRPQLLDRFALVVEVSGLDDPADRAEAVRRRVAFERDPAAFEAAYAVQEEAERARLARARVLLPSVHVPEAMLALIVQICAAFEVDGLRGDLAIYHAVAAIAAYDERREVGPDDVRLAAGLALPHRRRRQPFEQTGIDADRLDEVMREIGGDGAGDETGARTTSGVGEDGNPSSPAGGADHSPPGSGEAEARQQVSAPDEPLPLTLPRPPRRTGRASEARGRSSAHARASFGAPEGIATPTTRPFELAVAATLRTAAMHHRGRDSATSTPALRIEPDDLRARIRRGRSSALVLFAVDASGSMGARRRMSLAKSAALGLLLDAYRRRDRVGLLAFRDRSAEVLLPFTNSVDLAERRLRTLPTGGRTPLAAALRQSRETIERALRDGRPQAPLLVLFSDGRANVGIDGRAPWPAALQEAAQIRGRGWPVLMLDPDATRTGSGLGRVLAAALAATHLPLGNGAIEWNH